MKMESMQEAIKTKGKDVKHRDAKHVPLFHPFVSIFFYAIILKTANGGESG